MNDIELINKINVSLQETYERCMKLIEDGHAKDKEIAELKEQLSVLRCSHINVIEANAVEAAIEDYKKEYVGQGVEVLLQSFADSLREKS